VGELFEDVFPSLLLLGLVDAGRDEGYETASPHTGTTGDDIGRKSRTDVVNELSRGIEALTAVAEETGGIGLGVQVEKECSINDG
jgi:hypothetical protein